VQALKSKQEEVKQFATQYWRSAKQVNGFFDDFEKLRESDKHSAAYKDQLLAQ